MKEILIFDNYQTGHTSTTYGAIEPLKVRWLHASTKYGNPSLVKTANTSVVIYTDDCIWLPNKIGNIKVAWLLEPEEYSPRTFDYIRKNYKEFDVIFTWDKKLLEHDDRFKLYPSGNSWIKREEIGIYPKSKKLSMVASSKNFLSGHKIRHQILNEYMISHDIDWYGSGAGCSQVKYIMDAPFVKHSQNPISNLLTAYKDYMFTIVVENANMDYMFSEKIVSPILSGTVPIYYGMPSIDKFFNTKGMIIFNDINELEGILSSLSEEKYYEMLPYIKENYEKAKQYQLIDDTIVTLLEELEILKDE